MQEVPRETTSVPDPRPTGEFPWDKRARERKEWMDRHPASYKWNPRTVDLHIAAEQGKDWAMDRLATRRKRNVKRQANANRPSIAERIATINEEAHKARGDAPLPEPEPRAYDDVGYDFPSSSNDEEELRYTVQFQEPSINREASDDVVVDYSPLSEEDHPPVAQFKSARMEKPQGRQLCTRLVQVLTADASKQVGNPVMALFDTGATHDFVDAGWLDASGYDLRSKTKKGLKGRMRLATKNSFSATTEFSSIDLMVTLYDSSGVAQGPFGPFTFQVSEEFDEALVLSYETLVACKQLKGLEPYYPTSLESIAPEERNEEVHDLASMFQLTPFFDISKVNLALDFPDLPILRQLLHEFSDLFEDTLASKSLNVTPLEITLLPESRPRKCLPRRVTPQIQIEVDKEIKRLLSLNIIRPSSSSVASPIVVVLKPDGSIRLCIDYTELNTLTAVLQFPLPNIADILKRVGGTPGKKYFAKMELRQGYHQLEVHPNSIPLTAFVTTNGFYEFVRVPFGLKKAPGIFQKAMTTILNGLTGHICEIYIDDIIVYASSALEFLTRLRRVFEHLRSFGVLLHPSKCQFGLQVLEFLGHRVTETGIALSGDRVAAVQKLQPPKSAKGVRQFLGLCNAFRDYIENYVTMIQPLTSLTSRRVQFHWTDAHQEAFNRAKTAVCTASQLFHINYQLPLVVRTDASDRGVGGVLLQVGELGEEQPILFASQAFSPVASRWSTIEQEAYAIIFCLTKFESYLMGQFFTLETDHRNLLFLQKAIAQKLIRWRL